MSLFTKTFSSYPHKMHSRVVGKNPDNRRLKVACDKAAYVARQLEHLSDCEADYKMYQKRANHDARTAARAGDFKAEDEALARFRDWTAQLSAVQARSDRLWDEYDALVDDLNEVVATL